VEYQILVIAGLVLAFLHPATRKGIFNGLSTLASSLKIPGNVLLEVVAELTVQFGEAQLELRASQTVLETKIPRRVPLAASIEQASSVHRDGGSIDGIVGAVASTRSRRKTKRRTRKRPTNTEKH